MFYMFSFSLYVWTQFNVTIIFRMMKQTATILANEMWVPLLQLHQGASSSALHPLRLNCCLVDQTTQHCVQEAETQMLQVLFILTSSKA